MNKVTPIQAKWMISSTERQLEIDDSQEGVLVVGFLGYFGRALVDGKMTEKYHEVKIKFTDVKSFCHFPSYSAKDEERLDGYDWGLVPEFRDEDGNLANHAERFQKRWFETGICPDPACYEVANSSWIENEGVSNNLKHYLVLGGDYNLEVIAEAIRE